MKINNIYLFAAAAIISVLDMYFKSFYPIYGTHLSEDTAVWGQFGDYLGGTLNPLLSFISIVLLIKSLTLQNEANVALREELKNSEKTENFRLFNTLFFSMVDSQRNLFQEFKITSYETRKPTVFKGASAVIFIEEKIEQLQAAGANKEQIGGFIDDLDTNDQLFSILRAFYITVQTICEKLDVSKGFEITLAKEQILTLVNYTDFSHLRLIAIGTYFLKYKSTEFLRENELLKTAFQEVNLSLDVYGQTKPE